MFSFADDLSRRLKDIDLVADVMAKKVQTMKKEMDSKKEVKLFFWKFSFFYSIKCNNILIIFWIQMDALNDDFNGPNRIRIISQAKREMRKNKRVSCQNCKINGKYR